MDAVDLDPRAVAAAQRRLAGYGARVRLVVGSATDLRAAVHADDAVYDAVFDFAIIHHVEDWRAALAEVARVLRLGGWFYFDEVTATALNRPSYRRLFDHPRHDRFTAGDFRAELTRLGLHAGESWRTRIGGDLPAGRCRATRVRTARAGIGLRRTARRGASASRARWDAAGRPRRRRRPVG